MCCSEGGDSDTRRRAAADLVRALTDTFEAQVTELFTGYVGALLQVRQEGQQAARQRLARPQPLAVRCTLQAALAPLNSC